MNFYLDFEATRFSDRIISIGCTNERGAKFQTFVKPERGKVDKFITELTGITPEMVENAPSADEAFNLFYDWALENSENTAPKYFCYGDSDAKFIEYTVKTMSNFKAITFAMSIKAMLVDYSPIVMQYFQTQRVALKKVVALIENKEEIEQRHDALADAEMLRTVVENLKTKCSPSDVNKLAAMKSDPKPIANKTRAPDIFVAWCKGSCDRMSADTLGSEDNYQIKCWSESGTKYFNDIETAVLWVIRYCIKGKSPKKEFDLKYVRYRILSAVREQGKCFGFHWECNNNTK